jgi:hypothetical protein
MEFLLANRPFTAPSEVILDKVSEKPTAGVWQVEQDMPSGEERAVSKKIALPSSCLAFK